ncbi:beta and beta-prime subunits of DNA dependent RNA-polymerase [Gonapodya prolifera JEL478]|uniref:DNA-directed RNA polymerase subunit beta n=1 Tax=Gonapodya prolifera (strain JEL478) TaxID=1344416 RepID=A0A139AQW9_GONPJ|nr:beta and beta-prime subunits of DNA dependent RNA-polymerase [Gonapodya prolifera JEL478]|eukprot:KXS19140.1 beta and beta-prime subunits of DNA dependent RNA-polymerase [Gonapodya prolifera JEL478]
MAPPAGGPVSPHAETQRSHKKSGKASASSAKGKSTGSWDDEDATREGMRHHSDMMLDGDSGDSDPEGLSHAAPLYSFSTLERQMTAIAPSPSEPECPDFTDLSAPHIESFNALFQMQGEQDDVGLLTYAIRDVGKRVFYDGFGVPQEDANAPPKSFTKGDAESRRAVLGNKLEIWFSDVRLSRPTLPDSSLSATPQLFPSECRERGVSYKGRMQVKVSWRINDGQLNEVWKEGGGVPVMIKSAKCNLHALPPTKLIQRHEDPTDLGAVFLVNGIERLIRLLIVPRRHHPTALIRPSFGKRGEKYTHYGVALRLVRRDESAQTITLHYLDDGAVTLRFSWRKQEYVVPVVLILRALEECSDRDLFEKIAGTPANRRGASKGAADPSAASDPLSTHTELLLRSWRDTPFSGRCRTRAECVRFLGERFHVMLGTDPGATDEEVGKEFLERVLVSGDSHGADTSERFEMLILAIQKLFLLASGLIAQDNPDSPANQELLLGGFLYGGILKEKLADWLDAIGLQVGVDKRLLKGKTPVNFEDAKYVTRLFGRPSADFGRKLEYFLATGNLVSNTGLDLPQTSGFTVVAERLNHLRYLSHFRSVHRGAFFAELKTTTVRKLVPEAWGFLCPVHTPDGAPCGLLNHLAHKCQVVTRWVDSSAVARGAAELGVRRATPLEPADPRVTVPVCLDGKVLGRVTPEHAQRVRDVLRFWKVTRQRGIPLDLELALVPLSDRGLMPGLFMFTSPARMVRPVRYLGLTRIDSNSGKRVPVGDENRSLDLIGTFEQVFMDVACLPRDVVPGVTTHIDYNPTDMLSVVANLTPFSDFNQSPRNMYQCQMGKQTMGTPVLNFGYRTDNKLYRLYTGQSPIVRPKLYDKYDIDSYPNGINAVVAVIAYTGYDMEDAMIICKGAHERGFGHGVIYKSEFVDLAVEAGGMRKGASTKAIPFHFGVSSNVPGAGKRGGVDAKVMNFLDQDGLPHIGTKLSDGDPYYAYVDETTGAVKVVRYKSLEDSYVDEVRLLGDETGKAPLTRVHIKLRIPRQPVIGDKFSSRHGQKGVCSQKYPQVDMPFSESGIVPDVIINPHAFPSRMTIGMFVESLAGKAGAMHGMAQDATPFVFGEEIDEESGQKVEKLSAADYFGDQLQKAGYNYHGNEPMYSGITGKEFKADIYIGVVYYQRLRHMVSDKYQVRTVGPVHNLTQQPVKGRKRAGGIRFGEMERDSLLAHGTSFLLQDRLMNCSDYSQSYICKTCGSILTPSPHPPSTMVTSRRERVTCGTCKSSKGIDTVAIPYVFRYLATELLAMNIKLTLDTKS